MMWSSLSSRQSKRCSTNDQLELTQLLCVTTLQIKSKGKMNIHLYTILTVLLYLSSRHSSVEIRPELQKNILEFGYGINYKYEGLLAHSFDQFYVITKFILPTLDDIKLSGMIKSANIYETKMTKTMTMIKQNVKDLLLYCEKLRPCLAFYKMQIEAHNDTAHHILKNEVDLILPKFYEGWKNKRGI